MMKEYLHRAGQSEEVDQLDALCEQLKNTSTRQEVDAISELLSNFTSLTLEKSEKPG